MKIPSRLLLAAAAATAAVIPGSVLGVEATDYQTITAAGACQSNNPAINDVRVRVGGIINIGAPSVYVVCSVASDWRTVGMDGVTAFHVYVSNTSATPKLVSCTLQPGYTVTTNGASTSQGSFPKSYSVPANSEYHFVWQNEEVTGEAEVEISSPNVICLLPQGTMVQYLIYVVPENIGS